MEKENEKSQHGQVVAATVFTAVMSAISFSAEAAALLGLRLEEAGYAPVQTTGPNAIVLSNSPYGTYTVNIETSSIVEHPLQFLATSNNISSAVAGILVVTASASGLTNPQGPSDFLSQFSGNFRGNITSLTLQTYYNASNTLFAKETLLADLINGATPFATSENGSAVPVAPFSVTRYEVPPLMWPRICAASGATFTTRPVSCVLERSCKKS